MEFLVYLVGPITGISYGESTDWRSYAASRLPNNIQALSPLRGQADLAKEKVIKASYEDNPRSSQKGIACQNRFDVARADVILANFLGAKKVSIGSVMEIAWAAHQGKPVVVVMEPDNLHQHPLIRESAGYLVDNLDMAIRIVNEILTPAV